MNRDELHIWGRILAHNKLITPPQWEFVVSEVEESGGRQTVGQLLHLAGYINEKQLAQLSKMVQAVLSKRSGGAGGAAAGAAGAAAVGGATHPQPGDSAGMDLATEHGGSGPHPRIRQHIEPTREYIPDETQTIELVEHAADLGSSQIKMHATTKRAYVPDESETIDIEPEHDAGDTRRILLETPSVDRMDELAAGVAESAGNGEPLAGDGTFDLADELPDVSESGNWRPSEVDWVDSSAKAKDWHADDSQRIPLSGEDESDDANAG